MRWIARLRSRMRARLRIDPRSWRGAAWALRTAAIGLLAALAVALIVAVAGLERWLGVLVAVAIPCVIALVAVLIAELLRRIPAVVVRGALFLAAVMAVLLGLIVAPGATALLTLSIVVAVAVLGGAVAAIKTSGWRSWPTAGALGSGLLLAAIVVVYGVRGWNVEPQARPIAPAVAVVAADDPGKPGPYPVAMLTYGSGQDRHRPEFGDGADLVTAPVDGSKLIEGWSGPAGWARTRYWGFDSTALPLQGRVWLPGAPTANDRFEGRTPLPVVLIVHGNHDMEDYSDAGYAYLGQLFASRGFIAVSVDENFLNSSYADLLSGPEGGLEAENDARGWLLLQHLEQLRRWNTEPGNRFFGKLDLDRVVLIGHSRGGEAAAEAALFNRLSRYPDDARLELAHGFGIRGVIAIAPSDGQYDPRARETRLAGVSYLVVQGSLDGDVQSFVGSAQYERLALLPCAACFKASIYVVGANHGQFNTRWGRDDLGPPFGNLLNLTPILDAQAQRYLAQVLFSAFLEIVLHDDERYRALFVNPERGRTWFGTTELVARYADAADVPIATFEEDDDPGTATLAAARIEGRGLAVWREREVALKSDDLDSAAVVLGWTPASGDPASYTIRFDSPIGIGDDRAVAFALAMSETSPYEQNVDEPAPTWTTPESIDLHVVVEDTAGEQARVAISTIRLLPPPVNATTRKAQWLDALDQSEPVLRRYTFDAASLHAANSAIDLSLITTLQFVFDETSAGTILLDDVAISRG